MGKKLENTWSIAVKEFTLLIELYKIKLFLYLCPFLIFIFTAAAAAGGGELLDGSTLVVLVIILESMGR
jgi:hypothetical protein